jgi:hypothetical protein
VGSIARHRHDRFYAHSNEDTVLPCPVLSSCLVLSYLDLSCLVFCFVVLCCLVVSYLVLPCLVLSCLVLSYLVLSGLVLSCLVFHVMGIKDGGFACADTAVTL